MGDRGVALAFGDLGQYFALARAEPRQRRVGRPRPTVDQRLDDRGIDHRPARCNRANGAQQLSPVADPILQQIAAVARPPIHEGDRVGGLDVLREHDDAHLRMRFAKAFGDAYALAVARGGHAHVGDDDIRLLGGDHGAQLVPVRADAPQLDLRRA